MPVLPVSVRKLRSYAGAFHFPPVCRIFASVPGRIRTSDSRSLESGAAYCSVLLRTANLAYLGGFSASCLLSIAPYCARSGVKVVSICARGLAATATVRLAHRFAHPHFSLRSEQFEGLDQPER